MDKKRTIGKKHNEIKKKPSPSTRDRLPSTPLFQLPAN